MSTQDQAGYVSSWYSATAADVRARAPLTADLDVDVCVIGAGLAGLTTAREIARSGWSVAVLEARRIAWNASGHNCGFVLPGFAASESSIVERVGLAQTKELWGLSEAGLEYVRSTIGEIGAPQINPVDGWLSVSKVDDAEATNGTLQLLGQDLGAVVEGWPSERVRDVLRTNSYFDALHFPRAFHMHPLNYALGLAALAESSGASIFENTPALTIDPGGVRKRIETPRGRLRAAHVVLAGNVHIGALMPRVASTLLPIWTYVAVTAPLGPRLAQAVTFHGGVSDGERADNHYRIIGGDRLLVSGRVTVWEADPRGLADSLAADLAKLYPQLGEIRLEHRWSAVLGRTIHGMPQIGELVPGIWLASGFGGHGCNTTAMAGNLIARAIVDGDDRWRLFLPFELIWSGGMIGRAAAQIGYWWMRRRDAARVQQARAVKPAAARSPPWARAKERAKARAAPVVPSDAPVAGAMEISEGALPADPDLDTAMTRSQR